MRIGLFTDTFLPQRNGVVTAILGIGPGLVKRGHEVFLFCPRTRLKEFRGMAIKSYPSIRFKPYPEFKIAIPFGKVPELDIIHTQSPFLLGLFGLYTAKKRRIPCVSTFHTLLPEYVGYAPMGGELLQRATWKYCKAYYNRCYRVITLCKAIAKVLKQRGVTKPIQVIPLGINTDLLKPIEKEKARRKLGIRDEKVFLYLGRLGYEKKIDVTIKAMKKVDAKLIIAGRGPWKKKLQELVRQLGLTKKVRFAGYVPEKLKPLYLSSADAFVIASTSEVQPVGVMEAMACGCPVIGADTPAIREMVKDGKNGFLFKPDSPDALSRILEPYEPTRALQKNALKVGRQFSVENCVAKLEKLYSTLPARI